MIFFLEFFEFEQGVFLLEFSPWVLVYSAADVKKSLTSRSVLDLVVWWFSSRLCTDFQACSKKKERNREKNKMRLKTCYQWLFIERHSNNFLPLFSWQDEVGDSALKPFSRVNLYDEEVTYSPVFDKEFLEAALKLQLEIEALKVEGGITLRDVCHQVWALYHTLSCSFGMPPFLYIFLPR